jgi:hypothetical protein
LTGDIEGTVYDQQGAAIQAVKVTVRNISTGAQRVLTTSASGQFAALQLDLGDYEVTIEKDGFRRFVVTATVKSAEVTRLTVNMRLGSVSETVTVEGGAAPVLDVASAQLTFSVDAQLAINLPNQGRDPVGFAVLAPGIVPVTKDNPFLGSGSFNSNGSRGRANNITVDNVTSTDIATTGSAETFTFGLDAIQEAKVITNNFSAEFGRNSGAQVQLITKSGTNNYHGSVYWFHQNAAFNARDYFDTTGAATPLRYNLWGFAAGGPIIKNKTFVFGDYEGNKIRGAGSSVIATVLTPAQAAAITNPASAALFASVGAPTSPTGSLTSSGGLGTDAHSWLLKVDQLIRGGKDTLSMRYSENPFNGTSPGLTFVLTNLPNYGATNNFTDRQVNVGYTSTLSSTLVNQFRFLYGRSNPAFPPNTTLAQPFGPTIEISGFDTMGISRILPQGRIQNTYQYSDNLSWVRGRHSFKFGADVLRYLAPDFFDSAVRGRAQFGSLGDFQNGILLAWIQNFGATTKHDRSTDMFWFAQDEIRMTDTLTLNLGFRLESSGGVSELNGSMSNLNRASTAPVGGGGTGPLGGIDLGGTAFQRNWNPAPRLGFAWNPHKGKLVVRGGYGIAYDFIFYNPITNLRFSAPFVPGISVTTFTGTNTLANFVAGTAQAQIDARNAIGVFSATQKNFGTLSPVQQNLKNPRNQQFSLGLEYELKKDFVLKFTGTHTKNDFLQASIPLNLTQAALIPPPATSEADELARAATFRSFFAAENGNASGTIVNNRIDPRFNGVTQVQSAAGSNYNSLQIEAVKRMGHGLSLDTSYTWSHSIDNVSDALGVLVNDGAGLMDPRNIALNRANSQFDVRHRWILSYVYELPFTKHFTGPVGKILDGWAISNIVEVRSGLPVTIFAGSRRGISDNYLLGGTGGTMQANGDAKLLIPVPADPNTGLGPYSDLCGRGVNTTATSTCTNTLNFPLTQPLLGNPGNSGRNQLRLDGLRNVDFAILKNTRIMEGKNLQFRWEFYNILNTPSFSSFVNTLTSPAFGTYQGTATNMRQMQAALKFTF